MRLSLIFPSLLGADSLNHVSGEGSRVCLGALNHVGGLYSQVGIGALNCVSGDDSKVILGALNFVLGHDNSGVAIGASNFISGDESRIMLGALNIITANHGIIGLGAGNCITGVNSQIPIGALNCITGERSEVMGCCNFVPQDDMEWSGCCYPFYLQAFSKAYVQLVDHVKYRDFPAYRKCKAFAAGKNRKSSDFYSLYLDKLDSAYREARDKNQSLALPLEMEIRAEIVNILRIFPEYLHQFADHPDADFQGTMKAMHQVTNYFIEAHYSDKDLKQDSNYEEATCPLCTDVISDHEDTITLNCKHVYHKECLKNGLSSSIQQENLAGIEHCFEPSCQGPISLEDVARLLESPKELFALQRYFLRQLKDVKMCPSCSMGITQFSHKETWNMTCSACSKDLCYNCGKPAHKGLTCSDLKQMGDEKQLFHALCAENNPGIYGLCPNCKILIEKKDGCDQMTCGENASDKNEIGSHGCGHQFKWSERLKVTTQN